MILINQNASKKHNETTTVTWNIMKMNYFKIELQKYKAFPLYDFPDFVAFRFLVTPTSE